MLDPSHSVPLEFVEFVKHHRALGDSVVVTHSGGAKLQEIYNNCAKADDHHLQLPIINAPTMQAIRELVAGRLGRGLANALNADRVPSVAITGEDAATALCTPVHVATGFTGTINLLATDLIGVLVANGLVPVFSPLGVDYTGQAYILNSLDLVTQLAMMLQPDLAVFIVDDVVEAGDFSPSDLIDRTGIDVYDEETVWVGHALEIARLAAPVVTCATVDGLADMIKAVPDSHDVMHLKRVTPQLTLIRGNGEVGDSGPTPIRPLSASPTLVEGRNSFDGD